MSGKCNKCHQSERVAGDSWCEGCGAWEVLGKELASRWSGPAGLKTVANGLTLAVTREVRALRSLGAGIGRAPRESGAEPVEAAASEPAASASARAPSGLAAKSAAKAAARPAQESEEYTYEEESEEEDKAEDAEKAPDKREDTSHRSERARATSPSPLKRKVKEEERSEERLKRIQEEEEQRREKKAEKKKRKDRSPRNPREGREEAAEERLPGDEKKHKKKKKKGNRGGKKHKRVWRLAEDPYRVIHRGLPESLLAERPRKGEMAEEGAEGTPYGQWLSVEDSPIWEGLQLEPGDVVEFTARLVADHLGSGAHAAYLIREFSNYMDGSLLLRGRCLGCNDEEVGKTLTNLLNRRRLPLHLCWQEPCALDLGGEAVHVVRARFFKRGTFEAPYLKAWGRQFLRGTDEEQKEAEGGGGDPPGEGRKRAKPGRRPGGKKKEEKPGTTKKRPAGAPDLRGKLRKLREGLKAKSGGGAAEPILTTLALVEAKQEESEEVEDSEERLERAKALVKLLTGGEANKTKSSGSKRSGDSSYGEEEESSSSSEMLAPLQKRSSRQPGAVLRMLVEHAKASLDQSALVETTKSGNVTEGVKMASYFNLLVRPYHSATSRDMHHLAVCLDELRAGELGKLGDSLASRYLAIHTAVNEGTWRSAQYLELHPLEPTQGAPTALLLEAKKHGKLVNRSQTPGNEDWRRPRSEGEGGRGDGGNNTGGGWNKWSSGWWASQKDKPDGKDSKPSSKEGKTDKMGVASALSKVLPFLDAGSSAVHRPLGKGVFPIRLGQLDSTVRMIETTSYENAKSELFVSRHCIDSWTLVSVLCLNWLHGSRGVPMGRWRKTDVSAVDNVRAAVQRALAEDTTVPRSAREVEKELSLRFVSYTGEEVPRMEPLSLAQITPALPPPGHGGSVDVTQWTSGRTRSFLLHPDDCVVVDEGQQLPRLQSKVHIVEEDRMKVAELLVERGICAWISEDEVFRYRGEAVLSGMFGVAKPTLLPDGRPHLRVIMNLIPANAVMTQLSGMVSELPGITQYLSMVLSEGERVQFCQSDMTSAFYLFRLPSAWRRFLAFNFCVNGSLIHLSPAKKFYLSCSVLPMGWSSAVSVMQEVSQNLLSRHGLAQERLISRTRPLPVWLVEVLEVAKNTVRSWFHVYLDNFFSGERLGPGEIGGGAAELHCAAEEAWAQAGVISSEKKRVVNAQQVQELGARFDGSTKVLGVSAERMVKLLQTTCLVLSRRRVPRKWLQVVAGRWVHVLQFRRAGMSIAQVIWKWIGGKYVSADQQLKARRELCLLMLGSCLFHTFLGAEVSDVATASDASGTGGAVGRSDELSEVGKDFCRSLGRSPVLGVKLPYLVVSLFNGIGGAFRAYDLVGVEPTALIGYDLSKTANRITARRWPHAVLGGDVREIDRKVVFGWLLQYPHIEEVHLWGGFPCVDLSAVKFGRSNLDGEQSGLFSEILRILELLRQVFGRRFKIIFFVENVASMDKSAADQISAALGVKPYRVQCSEAVPISRPRFCWTNRSLPALPGIKVLEKENYFEITAPNEYPLVEQWIREDSTWTPVDPKTVFPTCMKAIKRNRPPPAPRDYPELQLMLNSGGQVTTSGTLLYKSQYVLWSKKGWRLLEGSERELLHGYGWGHTELALSASDIKKNYQDYEDARCSLVGDSFSMYSFVIFAWGSCARALPGMTYKHLCNRMGMAPGFCAPPDATCPLARKLVYGSTSAEPVAVHQLTRLLLARVNHTGSDVRISSGAVMNPKAYPRQSACSAWWCWRHVFNCRWQKAEHINRLELRSILLALRWRVQRLGECHCRFIHLTDSYVSMSIVSKGRSSSTALMSIMRQISAVQQRARRHIVLRDAGISKKTQERYYNSVSLLCKDVVQVTSMEDMDEQISDWIEAQFHKGAPLNVVADALSGMHYFLPSTRRRLPGSWKLFANWRKMEVPSRAPPLPEDLLWALMSKAVQAGQFDLASLLGLGFHCFLRTGELLSIRPMDLLLGERNGIVSLPVSKGRTWHNNKESVTITEPALLALHELVLYKRECRLYKVPIWVHTGTAFRKALYELFKFFGVEHLQFRGYSLRRGGATAFYARTGNMEQTLLRGQVKQLLRCWGTWKGVQKLWERPAIWTAKLQICDLALPYGPVVLDVETV
ncbi:unnamed protein product [Cladocopium goreaui]|uniref:DNA (cytosine-5-)-methyltransferase n=1 Tax=Cladocopium goreaui TaxID=2562237 RepID=A0A9P1FST7_9DINO|nr:unnamed protein product [Cladocopium goreaui]